MRKKKNILKQMLSIIFLGPLIPILGVVPEPNNSDGNTNSNNTDGNPGNPDPETQNPKIEDKKPEEKRFTQEEVDAIFSSRLEREKAKAIKQIEKDFKEQQERKNMTELDKFKADLEAEKKRNESIITQANDRLIQAEVTLISNKLNIVDPETAYLLINKENIDIDEKGNVLGVEDMLKKLVESKPYLVKTDNQNIRIGDNQNNNSNKPVGNNTSMNSLIRGYFKR